MLDLGNGKKMYVVVYYSRFASYNTPYGDGTLSAPYIVEKVDDEGYKRMLSDVLFNCCNIRQGPASLIREGYIYGLKNALLHHLTSPLLQGCGSIFSRMNLYLFVNLKYLNARLLDHIRSLVDSKGNGISIYED